MTFDTRVKIVLVHGDAAKKIAARLQAAGAEIIAKPQAFLVQSPFTEHRPPVLLLSSLTFAPRKPYNMS